jgi:hypothetical protein
MQVIAVHKIQGDVAPLAKELAAILGVTPYEVRPRVNVPGGGPAVVASFADAALAAACVESLHTAGFATLSINSAELESDQQRYIVQRLNFAEDGLHLWAQGGEQLTVKYSAVLLLLRGAGIITSVQVDTSTKKNFSMGRALATGGIVMRKKVTTTTTSVNAERQPFCHIYAPGLPALVLRQDELDYTSLGAACKLTREANFSWICRELRRLCGAACWDERLQTRAGLAQLLGPKFNPEVDLDLAISLLAKSYLEVSSHHCLSH